MALKRSPVAFKSKSFNNPIALHFRSIKMNAASVITVLSLLGSLIPLSNQYPSGAPESVCDTLTPFHGGGIAPQQGVAPYRILPSAQSISQGQTLRLEIAGNPPELSFGGFMVHARSTSPPYQVVGRFAPSADGLSKLTNCGSSENTVTHTSPSPKKTLGVEWQAPNDFVGEIIFNGTVAQDYARFWVGIQSITVQVLPRGASPGNSFGISSTRRPITTGSPSAFVPKAQPPSPRQRDSMYEGCGTTKTCFGFPSNCVASQSCDALTAVTVEGEKYYFEMKSGAANIAYIATALSTDDRMGEDAVMECVPENGVVRTYASWTTARPYSANRHAANYLRLVDASYVDGVIYCKVERDAKTTIEGHTFDLINSKYHLLLATGDNLRDNSVGYHSSSRAAAAQAISLSVVGNISGASVLLLRLHGAFMITAWIGTASIGILLARYFKQTWVGSQMCGKDQWFAWHRICMVMTWLLTIAGFIIIFVEIKGWSQVDNPHAILGVITTVLCFFQPIGAAFRPAPNSKNRPFFNWAHWLGGNLAHILASE